MGPEHGEVVSLASRYACFFEFELDAAGCPPQPGHQFVRPVVGSVNEEGRWGIGQFGEPGDPGDSAIGTPVAQVGPVQPDSWVGAPAVLAVLLRHGRKSRTRGDGRGLGWAVRRGGPFEGDGGRWPASGGHPDGGEILLQVAPDGVLATQSSAPESGSAPVSSASMSVVGWSNLAR